MKSKILSSKDQKRTLFKSSKSVFILLVLIFICFSSLGQDFDSGEDKNKNKPTLFNRDSIPSQASQTDLENLLILEERDEARLKITQNTSFRGKVCAVNEYSHYKSIAICSDEVDGLVLIVSRLDLRNGKIEYRSILISRLHKDMLFLQIDPETNTYYWHKKEQSKIIQD
jgi:hypothetical protein